jgi:hypothetical protein
MIQYTSRLLPSKDDGSQGDQQKDKNEAAKEALQKDEWKKEKVQAIKGKREAENEFFIGVNKKSKKGGQQAQTKEKEEPQVQHLNHQFETLNFFDALKISPPLFSDKLEETLRQLNEKKAYYLKLQEDAIKAESEKKPEDAKAETVLFNLLN